MQQTVVDELYANCVQEWNILYEMLEQDQQELPRYLGGDILEHYRFNNTLLLQQLDKIQKCLKSVYAE